MLIEIDFGGLLLPAPFDNSEPINPRTRAPSRRCNSYPNEWWAARSFSQGGAAMGRHAACRL